MKLISIAKLFVYKSTDAPLRFETLAVGQSKKVAPPATKYIAHTTYITWENFCILTRFSDTNMELSNVLHQHFLKRGKSIQRKCKKQHLLHLSSF